MSGPAGQEAASARAGQRLQPLPIAQCSLDLDGARGQRDRYRELGRHVTASELTSGSLEVRFGPGLDRALLEEAITVERECCSFFRLAYDSGSRRLSVTVETAEQEPALGPIADALGG